MNMFGGKGRGLYVPISEDEQEAITRLVEAEDLVLIIHEWGRVDRPRILVGDLRIGVAFRLNFNRPEVPMDVWFFDLELKTRGGISLCRQRMPTVYGGKPVQVCAGMFLDLQWDIALHSMDPRLVKMVKPAALGLTSLRQCRDTGEMTREGNMKLNPKQRAMLHEIEDAAAKIRGEDAQKAQQAAARQVATPEDA